MDPVQLIALCILGFCVIKGSKYIFAFAMSCFAFSSFVILPPSWVAGANISPTSLAFLALFATLVFDRRRKKLEFGLGDMSRFGLLTMYVTWSLMSALFFPRLFAGEILVYPVQALDGLYIPTPLSPSGSNITQSCYLILSFVTSLGVYIIASEGNFRGTLRTSVYLLSYITVITGTLDLLGLNEVLSIFRNANYALVGDTDIGGIKRIVGATPEASTFGMLASSCFAYLFLARKSFRLNLNWFLTSLATLAFSLLSTSSTAYGMLTIVFCAFVIQEILYATLGKRDDLYEAILSIVLAFGFIVGVMLVILMVDPLKSIVYNLADQLIFNKSSSGSYEERTRWTRLAYDAYIESNYIGVGFGSVRTSNSFVNILASTGIVGAVLLAAFIVRLLFSPTGLRSLLAGWGVQSVLLPSFGALALAGTLPDYGAWISVLFGIQVAANYSAAGSEDLSPSVSRGEGLRWT